MTNDIDEYDHYDAFDPVLYLHTFYNDIGNEGYGLLKFLHKVFETQPKHCKMLEFGGGPTILEMISAARVVSEIHFAEYVPANCAIVQRWVDGNDSDYDWSPYFEAVLQLEGMKHPSKKAIAERMQLLRQKVTRVVKGDIYQNPPLDTDSAYDIINCCYCLDSVTDDYQEWVGFIKKLSEFLRPGGTISLACLQEVDHCNYEDICYHNVYLTQDLFVQGIIAAGFDPGTIYLDSAPSDEHSKSNYAGVLFASAIKL